MSRCSKSRAQISLLLGVLFAAATAGAIVEAQEAGKYTVMKAVDDSDTIRSLSRAKDAALRNGAYSANETEVKRYYQTYLLPAFTQPANAGDLPALRRDLIKDLQASEKVPQLRSYLVDIVGRYMKGFVQSQKYKFHPAVRFNAMLVLAEMNAVERASSQTNFPVPDPAMTQFMLAEYKSDKQIDAVRVAALIGLIRHAKLHWGDSQLAGRGEIAQEMLALLKADAPANRHPATHIWMQRRAIDLLANLGALGVMKEAYPAIESIVMDEKADMNLRCTAAAALAFVDPKTDQVNISDASVKLAQLAVSASRDSLDWVAEYRRRKKADTLTAPGSDGSGGMRSTTGEVLNTDDASQMMGVEVEVEEMDETSGFEAMGGFDGTGAAADVDSDVLLAQRQILSRLYCIKRGLDGLEAAAASRPEDKTQFDSVKSQLDELLFAASPKETPDIDELTKDFRKAVRDLERFTKTAASRTRTVPVGAAGSISTPTGG